ncbi:catenin delta-1-like [Tropilaelaps mercedesae]|uniref:Catenin delta-1-like n=1 Tax=Tropilaelaps mercedesae TaxID=418985 RepID=A0A1V9XJG8_9ACAR|nr:catenin delta-1-like [Tropilaelaps mercedesae]
MNDLNAASWQSGGHTISIPVFKEFVLPSSANAYLTSSLPSTVSWQNRTSSPNATTLSSNAVLISTPVSGAVPRRRSPFGPSRQDGPSQPPQVQHTYSYETSQASTASNGGGAGAGCGAQLEDGKHVSAANLVGVEKQLVSRTQQEVKTQQVVTCSVPDIAPVLLPK